MASIQGIYVALFGRPADPLGLAYWTTITQNGADLSALAGLTGTPEYQAGFQGQSFSQVVTTLYQGLFGRAPDAAGLAFFVGELEAGRLNIGTIAVSVLDGAKDDDLVTVTAKVEAADLFTASLDTPEEIAAYQGDAAAALARAFIAKVDAQHPATPADINAAIGNVIRGHEAEPEDHGSSHNSGPVALPVTLSPVQEDHSRIITAAELLAGATDHDGDLLSITSLTLSTGSLGALVDNLNGTWTYTPAPNDDTGASFIFIVSDGSRSATSTAVLDIAEVNDAPVGATPLTNQTINEDSPFSFTVPSGTFSDVDNASLVLSARLDDGSQGGLDLPNWLSFDAATGTFTGTPPLNFNGDIAVTVVASDGEFEASSGFTLTVTPVNDAPVAVDDGYGSADTDATTGAVSGNVLDNDNDVDGDPLTAVLESQATKGTAAINADGSFVYTPTAAFRHTGGTDSFEYRITDGELNDTAVVTIAVDQINTAPTAGDDELSTKVTQPLTISLADLFGNDVDLDGDTLTLDSLDTAGLRGTLINNGDGTLTYDPTGAFSDLRPGSTAQTSFSYTISDGHGGTDTATVDLEVDNKLADFTGSTVQYTHRFPNINTVNSSQTIAVDGDGTTFAYRAGSGVSAFVTIDGDDIILTTTAFSIGFSQPQPTPPGFHAFRIEDTLDMIDAIKSVTAGDGSVNIAGRISYTEDSITFNLGGFSLSQSDRVVLHVEFF